MDILPHTFSLDGARSQTQLGRLETVLSSEAPRELECGRQCSSWAGLEKTGRKYS